MATLQQTGLAPGARMLFEVRLTARGQAFDGPMRAEARLEDSTGFTFAIPLEPEGTGRYVGEFRPVKPGLYRVVMVCEGTTPKLHSFRREQLATAAVIDERGSSSGDPVDLCARLAGSLHALLACLKRNPRAALLANWCRRVAGE